MNKVWLIIYLIISSLIKITPKPLLRVFAAILARLVWLLTPRVRRVIVKNLSHFTQLFSEQEAKKHSYKIYKNFVYYVFLMVKNLGAKPEALLAQISEFKNSEEFENLLKNGEKIVFITAHFSNWELLPSAVALRFGCDLSIVGKALKHESINRRLVRAREAYGVQLIEKTGAVRSMLAASRAGRILGLVSDQDAHWQESCEFLLCGRRVTQSKSAALIAQKTGAYLLPVFIRPDGGKFCIEFFPAKCAKDCSIEELSEYQLRCTEQMWRKYPLEYFWFHKRFKTYYEAEY